MTLFTSDTKNYAKIGLIYLLCCIFLALFGAVYEHFSFGVYSYFMLYAFAFPLVGGVLPALGLSLWGQNKSPWAVAVWLYRAGIATFSVGSIIRGVLDIYGTENVLTVWYWYAGGGLTTLGAAQCIFSLLRKCNHSVSEP